METIGYMPRWIILGGLFAIVIVVFLVAALFSGRIWAVLAGVVGTLLLVVGGLLAVGAFFLLGRSVHETAILEVPPARRIELKVPMPGPPPPALAPEAPDAAETAAPETHPRMVEQTPPEAPSGPPRPAWMDGPLGRVGNVYRTTVKVGPSFTRTECEQQLPEALRLAVRTYADHFLGEGKGQHVNLDMSYIRNHIVRGEWEERRQTTFDTMITLHELLEFDGEANETIEANYKQSVVMGRLGYTAMGGGGILGLLTILYGYLKLDTLTRGYYTGRLRLTAATAILALAAIAGLLVKA